MARSRAEQIKLDKVQDFADSVAYIIRKIDKRILSYERALGNTIRKIIEGNGRLRDYINLGVIIGLGVFTALLATSNAAWAAAARAFIATARSVIATFLDLIQIDLLIFGWRILMMVYPEYRKIFSGVMNAAAGTSERLGMSIAFVPAILNAAQGVVISSAQLLGIPSEKARFEFLDDAAKWIEKIGKQFGKYAKNPGAILDDLQNTIIRSSERGASNAAGQVLGDINRVEDTVLTFGENLFAVEASINSLVTTLPADVFAIVQEAWEPIHNDIIEWRETVYDPTVEDIQALLVPLEDLAEANAAKLAAPPPLSELSDRMLMRTLMNNLLGEIVIDIPGVGYTVLNQAPGSRAEMVEQFADDAAALDAEYAGIDTGLEDADAEVYQGKDYAPRTPKLIGDAGLKTEDIPDFGLTEDWVMEQLDGA